jgi:esterase
VWPDVRLDGEFGTLTGVAAELGLDPAVIPQVSRRLAAAGPGQACSVVRWGSAGPELVFLHGGGQNARTWDLVALDLGRPAIAVDLPGHGHSTWRGDHDYGPAANAAAVAPVIEAHAPRAAAVVGMSLGGLTTIALAADRPDLVRRAVLVDVTPGSGEAARQMSREQRGAVALLDGPRTFASLDEMAGLAIAASPRRPAAAVRRGVRHNARQLADGRWAWRYDRERAPGGATAVDAVTAAAAARWADFGKLDIPLMLVRGADSGFVTGPDLAEARRRQPGIRVETVPDAGHAVQSDQPRALSRLVRDFVFG